MFGAIRPLTTLNSQTLRPLLDDESEAWRAELGWDIASTADLIVRSAALNRIEGMVMVRSGRAVAYTYYHAREAKSVIGSAHAMRRPEAPGALAKVLDRSLRFLIDELKTRRIEGQFLYFGSEDLGRVFANWGFRLFAREFLSRDAAGLLALLAPAPELHLRRLGASALRSAAHVVHASFADAVDRDMSDCYESVEGCLGFLEGIVQRHGCGINLPAASFIAYEGSTPAGIVVTSRIGPRTAHVVQISVRPDRQRRGIGAGLLYAAIQALREEGFERVTLSVSLENASAYRWYRRLGFETVKGFSAHVYTK